MKEWLKYTQLGVRGQDARERLTPLSNRRRRMTKTILAQCPNQVDYLSLTRPTWKRKNPRYSHGKYHYQVMHLQRQKTLDSMLTCHQCGFREYRWLEKSQGELRRLDFRYLATEVIFSLSLITSIKFIQIFEK